MGQARQAENANVIFEATKNTKEHKDFVNSVSFVAKNNLFISARGDHCVDRRDWRKNQF